MGYTAYTNSTSSISWSTVAISPYTTVYANKVKSKGHDFKIGDIVQVVTMAAKHGWGNTRRGDKGVVIQIKNGMLVCFRHYTEWRGEPDEFIHTTIDAGIIENVEASKLSDLLRDLEARCYGRVFVNDYDNDYIYITRTNKSLKDRGKIPRWVTYFYVRSEAAYKYVEFIKEGEKKEL